MRWLLVLVLAATGVLYVSYPLPDGREVSYECTIVPPGQSPQQPMFIVSLHPPRGAAYYDCVFLSITQPIQPPAPTQRSPVMARN